MTLLKIIIIALFSFMITACSGIVITDKDGTIHHLIIGIGVVSTVNKNNAESVEVIKSKVLGLYLSDQTGVNIGAGYLSSSTLSVPLNSNVIIEVDEKPFGTINVKSKSFNKESK